MIRTHASCLAALVVLGSGPLWGAEPTGLTVTGTGEVLVRPNLLEIDLAAVGSAELTGDAVVKYRDSLRGTIAAFEKLKLKNLKIVQGGLGIQSGGNNVPAMILNGIDEEGQNLKSRVDIIRSLRLVLSGLDTMQEDEVTDVVSKLLDTAKDSGAIMGESQANGLLARIYGQQPASSVVTFVVEQADEVRKQAYQEAFRQAKESAQRLADLAQIQLGTVQALEEVADETDTSTDAMAAQFAMVTAVYGIGGASKRETRVVSDRWGEIPVRVTLRVKFAIQERTGRP
jgi:uncharacterized protein YggE